MTSTLSFGVFQLDTQSHRLLRDGRAQSLPPKAIDALEFLVEREGELITRQQLIEALWSDRIVEDQGLNQLVYLLRKSLGTRDDGEPWIETVRKRGYRFNGHVTRSQEGPDISLLSDQAFGDSPSTDPEVRAHLLRSRFLWHQWRPQAWQEAIGEARQALAIEADCAEARYWWGASLIALAISGFLPPLEAFPKARALLDEAIEIDPGLDLVWEGQGAIALFHDWDAETALRHLARAVKCNPRSTSARDLFALAKAASGDLDAAIKEARAALEIDPLSAIVGTDHGFLNAMAGRHEQAVDAYRSVLALHPLFAHARSYLSVSLTSLGEIEAAQSEAHRAVTDAGRDLELSHEMALAWVAAGQRDRAEGVLAALQERSRSDYIDGYFPMQIAAALGRLDEALAWLEEAIKQRSRSLCYIRTDPLFNPLRHLTGFKEHMSRILSTQAP
jgi:DNA-binding winged helix-turn-helix (wHTH) protein/Tfp pilus assembly protein PilF